MEIRKAKKADLPQIIELAEKYDLDSEDMRAPEFMVAEDGGKIIGIGRLRKHEDIYELCSLGVLEEYRKSGVGKELVINLLKNAKGEVYLATIIPDFFIQFGFKKVDQIPAAMVKKAHWCVGCKKENCTVMVRPAV